MYDSVGWNCRSWEDQERMKTACAEHWNRGWSTQDETERQFANMAAWQLPQLIEEVRRLQAVAKAANDLGLLFLDGDPPNVCFTCGEPEPAARLWQGTHSGWLDWRYTNEAIHRLDEALSQVTIDEDTEKQHGRA